MSGARRGGMLSVAALLVLALPARAEPADAGYAVEPSLHNRVFAQALRWYRRGAAQGDSTAQSNLAVMYENGRGVPRDAVEAYRWFSLAAQGLAVSDPARSQAAAAARDRLAQRMTAAELAAARRLIESGQRP